MQIFTSLLWSLLAVTATAESGSSVEQGFPKAWDGDRHFRSQCELVQETPDWLQGYLFAQLCASYGDQSAPDGSRLTHMFDAIGGLGVFELNGEKSVFTGAYYPNVKQRMWDFYERDVERSTVAWPTAFSVMNMTSYRTWNPMVGKTYDSPPNVDFWLLNGTMIGGTEMYALGLAFDPVTVDNFRPAEFVDTEPSLTAAAGLYPIHMPVHERIDPDTGLFWETVIVMNMTGGAPRFHQAIVTIDGGGVRRVQGFFDFPPIDLNKCDKDDVYRGDRRSLPRYMHSFSSTETHIVLPFTSAYMNPCVIVHGTKYPTDVELFDPSKVWFFPYDESVPMQFLLFDKRSKEFVGPIDVPFSQFISHQINAYDSPDGKSVIADMIGYDHSVYDDIYVDKLISQQVSALPTANVFRFTIDLAGQSVSNQSLIPADFTDPIEFPQFNHAREGKSYRYAYGVTNTFYDHGRLVKLDVDDHTGKSMMFYDPGQHMALSEPSFVPTPDARDEDDGVLVFRGLDTKINRTRVYVVDAKTMKNVGEILAPTYLPLGFHERFYTNEQLGLSAFSEGTTAKPAGTTTDSDSGCSSLLVRNAWLAITAGLLWKLATYMIH